LLANANLQGRGGNRQEKRCQHRLKKCPLSRVLEHATQAHQAKSLGKVAGPKKICDRGVSPLVVISKRMFRISHHSGQGLNDVSTLLGRLPPVGGPGYDPNAKRLTRDRNWKRVTLSPTHTIVLSRKHSLACAFKSNQIRLDWIRSGWIDSSHMSGNCTGTWFDDHHFFPAGAAGSFN
jgi:hypothetical protein